MRILLLSGHGINLNVHGAKLHIRDGRYLDAVEPEEYVYSPRRIDINHVVIYGRNGNLTLDAIRWLMKHNVQVSILNWDGKLLTTMLPNTAVQVDAKFAQYNAYKDTAKRIEIARGLILAKFEKTQSVLDYLKTRYSKINTEFSKESNLLARAKTIPDIMIVEGRVASFYWQQITKIMPKNYEFETREYQKRPRGAGDAINCMLNYGYAILEAECLKTINTAGLDPHIGMMHEKYNGKNSLAYDLQEPFRFLIDLAVIRLIENNSMIKSDFIRTESYTLRLRTTGAKKLLAEIDRQFNQKVTYLGKEWSWRYIIQEKTTELSHFLQGKTGKIDFSQPKGDRKREDTEEVRRKIIEMNYEVWAKKGFSRGTLHYMKHKAKSNKSFKIYEKSMSKIV